MKVAIMQPYFLPYLGYFQLINAVDKFVVYDNIEFTKKGWINRNCILVNGKTSYISLPLKKGSDYLDVRERSLSENWPVERKSMLNRLKESYKKSPFFECAYPVIEKILLFNEDNLFYFIFNSIRAINEYLGISTSLIVSSEIAVNHDLKSEYKLIELCKAINATTYINPAGGIDLYKKESFKKQQIDLHFLKTNDFTYKQFTNEFISFLSVVDVMMFNSKEKIETYLDYYELV